MTQELDDKISALCDALIENDISTQDATAQAKATGRGGTTTGESTYKRSNDTVLKTLKRMWRRDETVLEALKIALETYPMC